MRLRLVSCSLTLFSLSVASALADSQEPLDSRSLVDKANAYLSAGSFNDAVRAYSEAIELSPIDYILYYKRATAYYSLAKHQPALHDFEKVLALTSGSFDKALLMQGRIHVREGDWSEAKSLLKKYLGRVKNDVAAKELLQETSDGETAAEKARKAAASGSHQACIEAASDALRVAGHSAELRELRSDCALAAGDVQQAVGDLIRLTHVRPASTPLFMRIAQMSYFLLPPSSQAQSTLKQCLHFDPDSAKCAKLHKVIKKLDKAFENLDALRAKNDWRGVINHVFGSSTKDLPPGSALAGQIDDELKKLDVPASVEPLRISERRKDAYRAMCQVYIKLEQPKRAEWWCDELLRFEGNAEDMDGLIGRGEVALTKEQWEEAVRAFEKAFELSGRSSQDIMRRLQKAQKLLKQSRQKDYYKVLGVSRDADERTIKKAYRKVAKSAHPDKGGSEDKMAAVNEAYEVLTDPELRARFDNGDDPNDPHAQQGGHPFQQGGPNPFAQFFGGSGGFQFQQGGGGGKPFNFHFSSGGRH